MSVDFRFATGIQVGHIVLSMGYETADSAGLWTMRFTSRDTVMGVLIPHHPNLSRLVKWFRRRELICWICWQQASQWKISVYGTENVLACQKIADKLAEVFDVNILVELVDEDANQESLWNDFYR